MDAVQLLEQLEASLMGLFFFQMQHQAVGALAFSGVSSGGVPFVEVAMLLLIVCVLTPLCKPFVRHQWTQSISATVVCVVAVLRGAVSVGLLGVVGLNACGLAAFHIWLCAVAIKCESSSIVDGMVVGVLSRHVLQAAGVTEDVTLHTCRPALIALGLGAGLVLATKAAIQQSKEVVPLEPPDDQVMDDTADAGPKIDTFDQSTAADEANRRCPAVATEDAFAVDSAAPLPAWYCVAVSIGLGSSMLIASCVVDIPFVLVRRSFLTTSAADIVMPALCSGVLAAFVLASSGRLTAYLAARGTLVLLASVVFGVSVFLPLFLNQSGVGGADTALLHQSDEFLAQQVLAFVCASTAGVPFMHLEILLSIVAAHSGGEFAVLLTPTVFWVNAFVMVIVKTPHNFGFAACHLLWCVMMAVPGFVVVFNGVFKVGAASKQKPCTAWVLRGFACAMVLAVVVILVLHGPHTRETIECEGRQLHIGSFNVHLGLSRRIEPNLAAIANEIESSGVVPDVLALQETERASWHHGAIDLPRYLATRLGYRHIYYGGISGVNQGFNSATLSKCALSDTQTWSLPNGDYRTVGTIVTVNGWQLVNTHFTTDDDVHLSQASGLLSVLAPGKTIMVGDWNFNESSTSHQVILESNFSDAWLDLNPTGFDGTNYSGWTNAEADDRIDMIFSTAAISVSAVSVLHHNECEICKDGKSNSRCLECSASDHLALTAIVT